jgi:L-threonylcarbamoyladenylate synthase
MPPIVPATTETIALAAKALRDGRLVAFPTETVYGLGADADNPDAVRAIFAAKGRPADHPLIVHVRDAGAIAGWAREVPESAQKLARALWPGPLTLILPRAPHVHDVVTGGQATVGLRVPAHPVAQALLAAFSALGGRGIAAPSANRFGHVSPTTAAHVADDLADRVGTILDGSSCSVGIESTIVAFPGGEPMLLRPGILGADAIARVLGRAPRSADATAPRASGTLASHYAPRTIARLVPAAALVAEIRQHEARDESCVVLARTRGRPEGFEGQWLDAPRDPEGYARRLYASLRELDAADADVIVIEEPPEEAAWVAVRDRLARATSHDEPDDP